MSRIVLNHIKKRYKNGKSFAVKDMNLSIENREFIVFVGPSGCGKSTTLRMIAGLEEISEGDLYINEKRVNEAAPKDRDIAMVFQNYALYPHMTVYGNMAFGLKIRKFKKDEINRRVTEAANVLGLNEFLNRKPTALSGGQRQRVALGRAMVRNPKVFLMDEPLSNLDAKLRIQMRSEIIKLHRRLNATTIYVTHDQTEAMTMADRIVIMREGEIQQIGTPKEIYDNPANIFVGSFIGSPAMNFIPAMLSLEGQIHIGNHTISLPENKQAVLKKKNYFGVELVAGIRPEDIHLEHDDSSDSSTVLTAKIDVAELLGSECILYTKINNVDLVVKVKSGDFKSGDEIKLAFDMQKMRFFDPETGKLII
ncbi:sn-glycerol-3-phosphate ABC transporter ATP-binding protein UgpC [Sporolactobacillus shoreae]|uniref:sn-glycerol-3-phosphate ABC transporter ATP-binding protein UgpC n=1 Tax=Sporolactobacillus shoreae TaxID=1465501 RepID=A0A4Z0GTE4_9BACL|nr:sn-glycerol-3-phosphate ABC transporter ATP-binding protein UgpC [Sporolactobacillus shoreae]TGA99833.1 sn-glycerol-3-phosphate ABC transporter ATP-binding protein UgpC [Sporolactobacillus shoreae]